MTPQIDLFGVTISEPMTMFTDFAITLTSCWFGYKLGFTDPNRSFLSRRAWAEGFLFIGLGALLGGISHGFATQLSQTAMNVIWKGTLACVGFSMALAVAGTVKGSVPNKPLSRTLHSLNGIGLVSYIAWISQHDSFLPAIISTLVSLGTVAFIQFWVLFSRGEKYAKWILFGVGISFLSAAVQRSGIQLHTHFNHNDLYHVIQIGGLYCLFRGTRHLEDM